MNLKVQFKVAHFDTMHFVSRKGADVGHVILLSTNREAYIKSLTTLFDKTFIDPEGKKGLCFEVLHFIIA